MRIATNQDILTEQSMGDIRFITGGVGDEEHAALESVRARYNLRISNAEADGSFISDLHLILRDRTGNILLQTDAEPIFYAHLPNGTYQLEVSHEGQLRQKKIIIGTKATQEIRLIWQ